MYSASSPRRSLQNRRLWVLASCVVLLILAILHLRRQRSADDFLLQGEPLSSHLFALTGVAPDKAAPLLVQSGALVHPGQPKINLIVSKMSRAHAILSTAGTNCLPLLERWMQTDYPP